MSSIKIDGTRLSPAAHVTAAILSRLEEGVRAWVRPWRTGASSRPLRACGTPYKGINTFWLWLVADRAGYASPYWMTYRQARALGGQVRKRERASIAVFYKDLATRSNRTREDERPTGHDREMPAPRRIMRSYRVFNADQVDGLPADFILEHPADLVPVGPQGREAALDAFFAAIPAKLRHQGDEAYYEPLCDRVTMPPPVLFHGYDHYYATLAHELSHWTGHASRLARDLSHRFGTRAYAAEELVAELASAIIGAELGLPVAHLDHHASYIAHWIELLKSDQRAILSAAARAEEAAALVLSLGARIDGRGDQGGAQGPGRVRAGAGIPT